ncbi:unnamed protein product, partial [Gadus morhua 'NCC']
MKENHQGLEVPLVAVLQWSTAKMPFTNCIYNHYRHVAPRPTGRGHCDDADLSAVVCHTPLSNLGHCRRGSTLSFTVAFQILKPGLYELSQHMKLKLQFTASVTNPPPDARPLSRKNSPSSPAVRDLLDRHQASLGRSQSFSHQQPSRSHIM